MSEAAMKERLRELLGIIVAFPASDGTQTDRDNVSRLYCDGKDQSVEGVVDGLRVQIKYLLFDLEATRRENRYLRQMLETRPPHDGGRGSGGLS